MDHALPTVIHIEDDPLWRECIAKILSNLPLVQYGGAAATAIAGLELCRLKRPNIILLDLRLPDRGGLELINDLSSGVKIPRILFLTVRIDEFTLFNIIHNQIAGMIWKNIFIRKSIPDAITSLLAGHHYFPAEIQEALKAFRTDPNAFFKILSDRELDLLPLLGRGESDEEIGKKKGIHHKTVKSHREHIMSKLGVHGLGGLIRTAAGKGFVDFSIPLRNLPTAELSLKPLVKP